MMDRIVVQSGVRLVRNYADLPFAAAQPDAASRCLQRVRTALGEEYTLLRMADLDALNRSALAESRRISPSLALSPAAAVFVRGDAPVTVSLGGRDHVHVRSVRPGMALREAAADCLAVDDLLSGQARFAFDEKLGYLTASLADTGTGMRGTVLLHLPLLQESEEWQHAVEKAARAGLILADCKADHQSGAAALCKLYNGGSLRRTENETIVSLHAAAEELAGMEERLRTAALEKNRAALEDRVFRAWGILQYARLLEAEEFETCWSGARLGAALGLLPCSLQLLDALPEQVCEAHLCLYAGETLTGDALNACRAERVRSLLKSGGLL